MSKASTTGFHVGVGGNKDGIGVWMRALNDAGIAFPLKSVDEYGVLGEALSVGNGRNVVNWLVYRMTEQAHSTSGVRETPDYTLPPFDAAVKHWRPIEDALPPEFDKTAVYVEPFNEIRMKKSPDDVQYKDMNAADWMGECCYHLAVFANGRGFKVALPAINSGEPGEGFTDADMMDVVAQYSTPGMLRFIRYAADNPDTCLISIHEYIWNLWKEEGQGWDNWYPYLFGRFEGLIAAADNARIPRTFKCIVSEWGWGRDNAPTWAEARPHIEQYTDWMARFPQIVGTAIWTMQGGKEWGGVSNDVQKLIKPLTEWTLGSLPDIALRPQITHELFGSTLPFTEPEPPIMKTEIIDIPADATELHIAAVDALGNVLDPTISYTSEKLPLQIMVTVDSDSGGVEPPPLLTIAANAIGVDISKHQGKFDFDKAVENGIEYFIIRSSNGLGSSSTDANGRDKQLHRNAAEATRVGKPWAIYHFLQHGQDIVKQAALVNDILAELKELGTYPRAAVFSNDVLLPTLFIDVEQVELTAVQIKEFSDNTNPSSGIYSRQNIWTSIMKGSQNWWSAKCAWIAAYGKNDGTIPNWKPGTLFGFDRNSIWQFTSTGGDWAGHAGGLDVNIAHPFDHETTPPPVIPPPSGEKHHTDFMRADTGVWRVVKRADGSGEDVWELRLSDIQDVRVKNRVQGEWYEYRLDGVYRLRDTSPAPDSQGNERLYRQHTNGVLGGQIAPLEAETGVTYEFFSDVQFKRKSDCADLAENSGENARSTFLLKEIIDNHTFSTGATVDKLYVTVQTGEVQLYAENDGRLLGWVGGGSSQEGNTWAAELNEVYFDRPIPADEPDEFCD